MLELRDLHTYYGDSYILQGVSLRVEPGQVVAVLGRNGVGKTTLLRSVMGLTPPRRGQVMLEGRDITGLPPHRISRLGIGYVPQGRRIFNSLTVHENLSVVERPRSVSRPWPMARVLQLFPILRERAAQLAASLSGGQQQMLAIGRGLLTNPKLLVMDEPTEGLAPLIVRELEETLRILKASGASILLAEQRFGFAVSVADRAYILAHGRTVAEGVPEELWDNQTIKHTYLGV
ncbi:MAG TPA: ABC transporter ATP-binding protein [Chloroflexota bacterium]|nr:ABC transporter ATP-binding protein [Chloroflexota bacterium]